MRSVVLTGLLFLNLGAYALPPLFGNEGAHGGDDVALEFQESFATAYTYASTHIPGAEPQFVAKNLVNAAGKVLVLIVDKPLTVELDGQEQESVATNMPDRELILVNRARWLAISNVHLQEAIALHEYLSIVGLESTGQYEWTNQYVASFGLASSALNGAIMAPPVDSVGNPPAISDAYKRKLLSLQNYTVNEDLSVTIKDPFFLYRNDRARIIRGESFSKTDEGGHEVQFISKDDAVCLMFGLHQFMEAKMGAPENYPRRAVVRKDGDGPILKDLLTIEDASGWAGDDYNEITCRP